MTHSLDSLASKYDRLYPDELSEPLAKTVVCAWPRNRDQALVHLARPGGRLLEIGCGRGVALYTLAARFTEAVGIELSSVQADAARRNLASLPNCRILTGSLEDLVDVLDSPFDCIVWGDVIEHIVDVVGAVRVLARLSHRGTQLISTTPNVAFLPIRLRLLFGRSPCTGPAACPNHGFARTVAETVLYDAGHLHYFTFRQVEMLYRLAGFVPERRMGFGRRLSRLRNMWPTLLSGTVCISGTYRGD